jgi:4-hydroxy-3-polyprenylbenzoate decarboxylase
MRMKRDTRAVRDREPLIVAITGASGAAYAYRCLKVLHEESIPTYLIVTTYGEVTLRHELGLKTRDLDGIVLKRLDVHDVADDVASGTTRTRGMVIIPCTMNKLAEIASGLSSDLVLRCADVMLKEGRPLVLVPRETPFNESHLCNMLRLRQMGAKIVPAMPAFYHKPKTIDDMIDFVVARTLDQLGISHPLSVPYQKAR